MKMGMLALGALGLLAATGHAQENYATWSGSRNITINTTAASGGANVAGTVANFPVLVRLTSAQPDVFLAGGASGASIRFTAVDGTTRLKHQLERWDSTGQTAEFWVLVPSVAGNANTVIKLYYGKSGVSDSSNGAAVFDTANGYKAVYHMSAGGTGRELDATANGFYMAPSVDPPTSNATGAIGAARTFSGTNQWMRAPGTASNSVTDFIATTQHTLSAWAYASAIAANASTGNSIVTKGNNQYLLQIYGGSGTTATTKFWESAIYTTTWRQNPSAVNAAAGAWYHITGTWDGTTDPGTAMIYINGVLDNTANPAVGTPSQTRTFDLHIGVNPNGAGTAFTAPGDTNCTPSNACNANKRFWNGHLDEITVSRGVRSADWVKLNFETQKSGATAVVIGNNATAIESARDWNPGFAIRGAGNGFVFSVPGAGRVAVLDIKGREVWSRSAGQAADVTWNGLAADGSRLSGAFVARVTARVNGVETTVAQRSFSMIK